MGMRLAVLASGQGTNFEAIARAVKDGSLPHTKCVGLICNKPQAPALARARELEVPSFLLMPGTREEEEKQLLETLHSLRPDLICLAGYMRILSPKVIAQWPKHILNIHPSLLPLFPGLHAQRQALAAGAKETGCTVHFVNEQLDAGPIVLQRKLKIAPADNEQTLAERLRVEEHQCYVEALRLLVTRKYRIEENRVLWD